MVVCGTEIQDPTLKGTLNAEWKSKLDSVPFESLQQHGPLLNLTRYCWDAASPRVFYSRVWQHWDNFTFPGCFTAAEFLPTKYHSFCKGTGEVLIDTYKFSRVLLGGVSITASKINCAIFMHISAWRTEYLPLKQSIIWISCSLFSLLLSSLFFSLQTQKKTSSKCWYNTWNLLYSLNRIIFPTNDSSTLLIVRHSFAVSS